MYCRRRFLLISCALLLGGCASITSSPDEVQTVAVLGAPEAFEPLRVVLVPDLAAQTAPSGAAAKAFTDLQLALERRLEYAASRSGWFRVLRIKRGKAASDANPLDSLPASVSSALTISLDHLVIVEQGKQRLAVGAETEPDFRYEENLSGVKGKVTLSLWQRAGKDWEGESHGTGDVNRIGNSSSIEANHLHQWLHAGDKGRDVSFFRRDGSLDVDSAQIESVLDQALALAMNDMAEGGLESAIARIRQQSSAAPALAVDGAREGGALVRSH